MKKKMVALIAALLMMFGLGVANAASASASVSWRDCGANYAGVNSWPISNGSGTVLGYIRLYINSSTGTYCAFTEKTYAPLVGVATWTSITFGFGSYAGAPSGEAGSFLYYAGPVYVLRDNTCGNLYGEITDLAGHTSSRTVSGLC